MLAFLVSDTGTIFQSERQLAKVVFTRFEIGKQRCAVLFNMTDLEYGIRQTI